MVQHDSGERQAALERIATVRTEARIPGLVDLLTEAGVPVIVLKGPVTRQRYYEPGEDRPTSDVDLLVRPGSFRRAVKVLVAAGHERVGRGGHSDTFRHPDGYVDLHIVLPYSTVAPARAFRILAGHTTTLTVAGRQIPVLDHQAHAVHLAMHAAQNSFRPEHRSLEEWRRAKGSLWGRDAAEAEGVAEDLGASLTWNLATLALVRPAARADLAASLPVRKPKPSLTVMGSFARSPIPLLVKVRVTRAHVRRQLSDDVVASWRERRGLRPVTPGTAASGLAKVHRLVVATAYTLTGSVR